MLLHDGNLADSFNTWISIYEYLTGESPSDLDYEVWQIARQHEEMPIIENIYQELLLSKIEHFINESYDNISVKAYINGRDTHLSLVDEEGYEYTNFYCLSDFKKAINSCHSMAA